MSSALYPGRPEPGPGMISWRPDSRIDGAETTLVGFEGAIVGQTLGMTTMGMTTIEMFQSLQIELVRSGFATRLDAKPDGDEALVSLTLDLRSHSGGATSGAGIAELDELTAANGFSYVIGENSLATVTLARG